jgi:uncharacterized protein (DUF433 family)
MCFVCSPRITTSILEAYPYLEEEDIDACLEYAAMLANESEVEAVA